MFFKRNFCNSAWFEFHIYWDGTLGHCCGQTPNRPYPDDQWDRYNIKNCTVKEFYNSEPMRKARLDYAKREKNPHCEDCWHPEDSGESSRRNRSNQKSVIFQKQNFDESIVQSPHYNIFKKTIENKGSYDGLPVEFHIDLGNHCNLACKMCNANASSKIAAQELKWGTLEDNKTVLTNWSADKETWNRFMYELLDIPSLTNIHFMGGETLLSINKIKELVDLFDAHNKHDVCFSFVTNGTVYDEDLINKLKKFKRTGIEVSIETTAKQNEYIRQGSDNKLIIENIEKFNKHANDDNITVTLRTAISNLSVGYYDEIIDYALKNNMLIMSLPLTAPEFMKIDALPYAIRQSYKPKFEKLLDRLKNSDMQLIDFNERDPHNYSEVVVRDIKNIIFELDKPDLNNQEELLDQLVEHMKKWDPIFNLNAYNYYPELADILNSRAY